MDLEAFRKQHMTQGLSRKSLAEDPIEQFQQWFGEVPPLSFWGAIGCA